MILKYEDIEDSLDVDENLNFLAIKKVEKIKTLKNKRFI